VFTCVFLLCQEFFDMILINNPSFYDGGGGFTIAMVGGDGMDSLLECVMLGARGFLLLCPIVAGA
jgi:hypothetical protein